MGIQSIDFQLDRIKTAPDSFVRIEDKFLVRKPLAELLYRQLESRLDPSYLSPTTRFTQIESQYLDSDQLTVYRSHFEGQAKRFKIRTRRYFPNGVADSDEVHLELKSKEDKICTKVRFKLGAFETSLLARGLSIPISMGLLQRNIEIDAEKVGKRLKTINRLMETHRLRPQCVVTYNRKAYERDGLRVTVDDDIRSRMVGDVRPSVVSEIRENEVWNRATSMRDSFLKQDFLVVEVKHSGQIPSWLNQSLIRMGSAKVSFSKYCFSVSDHLNGRTRP